MKERNKSSQHLLNVFKPRLRAGLLFDPLYRFTLGASSHREGLRTTVQERGKGKQGPDGHTRCLGSAGPQDGEKTSWN